jgi:aspartate/tyrosine/aromatic aminotransferase
VRVGRFAVIGLRRGGPRPHTQATVLHTDELLAEWLESLKTMSGRIKLMRSQLKAALVAKGTPGSWNHICDQIGMFSFTGLTPEQVEYVTEKYHIYLLKNGRVNMCGLTEPTVLYLATAIDDAVRNAPSKL